jgi:hypothetical protein
MARVRTTLIANNRVIVMWIFGAMAVIYLVKGLVPLL